VVHEQCASCNAPTILICLVFANANAALLFLPHPGDPERGYFGNKCYVECSRRGTCDYKTGTCKCFQGSWGAACENIANAGRRTWEAGADTETFWLSGSNSSIIVEGN